MNLKYTRFLNLGLDGDGGSKSKGFDYFILFDSNIACPAISHRITPFIHLIAFHVRPELCIHYFIYDVSEIFDVYLKESSTWRVSSEKSTPHLPRVHLGKNTMHFLVSPINSGDNKIIKINYKCHTIYYTKWLFFHLITLRQTRSFLQFLDRDKKVVWTERLRKFFNPTICNVSRPDDWIYTKLTPGNPGVLPLKIIMKRTRSKILDLSKSHVLLCWHKQKLLFFKFYLCPFQCVHYMNSNERHEEVLTSKSQAASMRYYF